MATAARAHTTEDAARRARTAAIFVAAVTGCFVVLYSIFMVLQFNRYHVHAFDFAIFDQGLWLLSRFEEPFVTVRGLHLFADHSSYVMLLFVPIYWVAPHPEVLIVLTVAILGAGAPLAYALARTCGASPTLAAVLGVGYVLHPAVAWAARDGFHPEYVVIPLVMGAVLSIHRDRHGWAAALVAVALLAKEDVALLVVPLGIYVALAMGKRRLGTGIAVLGMAALVLNFGVLLPHFSPTGDLLYSDRYDAFGRGLLGIAGGMLSDPQLVLARLFEPSSLGYTAALLLPIPAALLAPRVLLIGIPTLLANVLSEHTYQSSIEYHYTAYLIAVVVLAGAAGMPVLMDRSRRVVVGAALLSLVVALGAQVWLAPNPLASPEEWAGSSQDHGRIAAGLALIPDDAVVSVSDTFVPHMAHRRTVYQFPNPWRRHNYGPLDVQLPDPGIIEWVAVRTDAYPSIQPVVAMVRASPEFRVVYDEGPMLVLRRSR